MTMVTLNSLFLVWGCLYVIKEYNMLEREYANGIREIRLYKKGITKGTTREPPVINTFTEPFENKKIYCSKMLDADGFTVTKDNRISQQKSLSRTISKIYDYANSCNWHWFVTFTFSDGKVNRYDFDSVSKYMTNWLNNMRKKYCPNMKYVLVPELHKDGAWHFHGLFADCDGLNFVPAVNLKKGSKYYGQPLKQKGQQIYSIKRFKCFSSCTKIRDTKKASSYITKYITKEVVANTSNRKRYWCSRGLATPKEKILLATYTDFDEFKNKMLVYLSQYYDEVYTNKVELCHGDFENEILYIRFSDYNGLIPDEEMDGIFEVE